MLNLKDLYSEVSAFILRNLLVFQLILIFDY